MEFKDVLIELCEERNTNIKEVCKNLGIDNSGVYKYLHGMYPRVEKAVLLANYFDCSLNYLFGIDDAPKKVDFKSTFDTSLFITRNTQILEESKTSHYAFCNSVGLNKSTLYFWKKGKVPYFDVLIKIAKTFGCSLDYLVGRSDSK